MGCCIWSPLATKLLHVVLIHEDITQHYLKKSSLGDKSLRQVLAMLVHYFWRHEHFSECHFHFLWSDFVVCSRNHWTTRLANWNWAWQQQQNLCYYWPNLNLTTCRVCLVGVGHAKLLLSLSCGQDNKPAAIQQSIASRAVGWIALQLSVPQISPRWQSSSTSQSPCPSEQGLELVQKAESSEPPIPTGA